MEPSATGSAGPFRVTVRFAKAFRRHVECPDAEVEATTVGEALRAYFAAHPAVRGYVLDDQGAVRRHVTVFADASAITDRARQSDPLQAGSEVEVFQALSGG